MDSFTIELVSSAASGLFPDNPFGSFTNFIPDQVNLEEQWNVAISELSYLSRYQNVTDGKFLWYDAIYTKTTTAFYMEPGLCSSVTDIVEAMKLHIQEKNNHNEIYNTVKVSRRIQKSELSLTSDFSRLIIFRQTREVYLVAMLMTTRGFGCEVSDLMSQSLRSILFVFIRK